MPHWYQKRQELIASSLLLSMMTKVNDKKQTKKVFGKMKMLQVSRT